jgi:hypothetical protein
MNNETCKTRKQQFIQAVRILAPGDQFIHEAARGIPEDKLPIFPGGAALEFVAAMERLKPSTTGTATTSRSSPSTSRQGQNHQDQLARVKPAQYPKNQHETFDAYETETKIGLALKQALRIKNAEYWLKLGEAELALRELEGLPSRSWNHPAAMKARVAAMGALRERSQISVQE